MNEDSLQRLGECLWEIPRTGRMRVPARIYTSAAMLPQVLADNAPQQAANVACLPGIVGAALAMPDIHWGYGFPIGGVAAFDAREGVISPGGVGYDINCGVRLMATRLTRAEVKPRLPAALKRLFHGIPSGVGSSGALKVARRELEEVAVRGAEWAVARGFGREGDLDHIEERGRFAGADPRHVSERAWQRGLEQLGTLGSGNHFLEIGFVDELYDAPAARTMGLELDQVTVLIHCGSRGYGHQICDDHLARLDQAVRKYDLDLPDRQLACAPLGSPEADAYLAAMACAVNYAFANRQAIAHQTAAALEQVFDRNREQLGLRTIYEVGHNLAKFETHIVEGQPRKLCVHRKGATRAFAPGAADVPAAYRAIGQPVLIPGDMGRYSFVLTGTQQAMTETFGSTCHGAGRLMSRHQAIKMSQGRNIAAELGQKDILVMGQSRRTLEEEIPEAYKDVASVVDVCVGAGISRKVARLRPMGCIKG